MDTFWISAWNSFNGTTGVRACVCTYMCVNEEERTNRSTKYYTHTHTHTHTQSVIGWLNDCIQYGYWSIEQLINPLSWTVNKSLIFSSVVVLVNSHSAFTSVSTWLYDTWSLRQNTTHLPSWTTIQIMTHFKWMLEYSYLFTIRTWSLPKQQQQQQKWNKIYKKLKREEEEEDTKHDTPNIITADETGLIKHDYCWQHTTGHDQCKTWYRHDHCQ